MYNIHCIHCICTLGVEEVSTGGCHLLFFVVAIFSIFNILKECLFNLDLSIIDIDIECEICSGFSF